MHQLKKITKEGQPLGFVLMMMTKDAYKFKKTLHFDTVSATPISANEVRQS
jgi:hypothetical protein